jgi:hypothetical protein
VNRFHEFTASAVGETVYCCDDWLRVDFDLPYELVAGPHEVDDTGVGPGVDIWLEFVDIHASRESTANSCDDDTNCIVKLELIEFLAKCCN